MQSTSVIGPREVPLGGVRSMTVRRTLPARGRSFVGAWCFVDHYGPDDVAGTGGMDLPPHPHCGMAAVSWLFNGELTHRDSLGNRMTVRPGEVNFMTAGHGISHSEVSTPDTSVLHGAQLWVVLPGAAADIEPRFEHYVPPAIDVAFGVQARVFVGSLFGDRSPVRVETPLLGAEVRLEPGTSVVLVPPEGFEIAVLVDVGSVEFAGLALEAADLGVVEADHHGSMRLLAGDEGARVLVLGGEPFGEEVVMWWNFVARSHDEVLAARQEWMRAAGGPGRFGEVAGYEGDTRWIPAPEMPGLRLKPRGNRA